MAAMAGVDDHPIDPKAELPGKRKVSVGIYSGSEGLRAFSCYDRRNWRFRTANGVNYDSIRIIKSKDVVIFNIV
tara:strand:- start:21 stop:242 length:222 start_codon:yes stop_codon:yes gene_type:complete